MKKRRTAVMMAMVMTVCMLSACGKNDEPVEPVETEPMIEVGQQNLGRATEEEPTPTVPEDVYVPPTIVEHTNIEYNFSEAMINTIEVDFASPDYKNSLLFMTNKEYQDYIAVLALPAEERPKKFTPDKRLHIDGEDFQDFSTDTFHFKGFAIKQNDITVGYAEFFKDGVLIEAGQFDDNKLDDYVLGGIYTDYTTTHYYDDDMNEVTPPATSQALEPTEGDEEGEEGENPTPTDADPTPTETPFNPDDYTQYHFDNFFIFDKSVYCGNGRKTGVLGTTPAEMFVGNNGFNEETMTAYYVDTVNTLIVYYDAGDPKGKNDYEKGEKVRCIYLLRNDINS